MQTSVCYDPLRAVNSAPDEIEIKPSTIPNAGFGAFAKMYIEQDTVFAPYKGTFEPETDVAGQSGYSWKVQFAAHVLMIPLHCIVDTVLTTGLKSCQY
jgi:hypothetical protein